MRLRFLTVVTVFSLCTFVFVHSTAGDERGAIRKTADDSDREYTTAGSIGLTVSNFGTIGTRNAYWPTQPSCEYPRGSRIEHLYQGGLWVGAELRSSNPIRDGLRIVTTGSSDQVNTNTGKGYEFVSVLGSTVIQRSSLSESRFFDENAISHQDFLAHFAARRLA